jgi:dihydrofolate reductase
MKAIAAMGANRVIGKDYTLPWPSIKEDFKHFREFTMGKILIVGHKTFSTLPVLKNRNLIVLTRYSSKEQTVDDIINHKQGYDPINNMGYCYRNQDNILDLHSNHKDNLVVIGGAKTYELFLPNITEFYVTHVNGEYDGDTFMPAFEHLFNTKEIIREFEGGHKVIKYSKLF